MINTRHLSHLASVRLRHATGLVISAGFLQCALAQPPAAIQSAVEKALGRSQTQDNVLTYTITRILPQATVASEPVACNFQFAGQLFLTAPPAATPNVDASTTKVWVIGEVPLLEEEVPAFVATVQTGGLSVNALHHHLVLESPRVIHAHISGTGDAEAVAKTLKTALDATGNIFTPVQFGGGTGLNDTTLLSVIGGRMNIVNGVVYLKVPRREQFLLDGNPIPRAVNPTSMVTMDQPAGKGAKVAFELVVVPSEVEAVTRAVRASGMSITAIHNRTTSLLPDLTTIHGWAVGDSTAMAVALRDILNKTNSEGSPKGK